METIPDLSIIVNPFSEIRTGADSRVLKLFGLAIAVTAAEEVSFDQTKEQGSGQEDARHHEIPFWAST